MALTASEKAQLLGMTEAGMRKTIREYDRRVAHGLHIPKSLKDEADLARAALGGKSQEERE